MRSRGVAVVVCAALAFAAVSRAQTSEIAEPAYADLPLARVLPVAGSLAGAADSFFKTSVQIFNPQADPLVGAFMFHASGTVASSIDPSMSFRIPPLQTLSFDDILPAMGLSGLGTVDIQLNTASHSPAVIVARVYNDADDAGTAGFTEDAISPEESGSGGRVIDQGETGYLVFPADLERFRFNIGIRTLSRTAVIEFMVRDEHGLILKTLTKDLGTVAFQQHEAGALLGMALPPAGSVRVAVTRGIAIVYGATTDNITNDPSIQFARTGF